MMHLQSTSSPPGVKSQDILASSHYDVKVMQIPLHELRTNPFAFKAPAMAPRPTPLKIENLQPTAARNIDRSAALRAAKHLRLQSVLSGGGGQPMAMINGNLLAVGQTVEGWTIARISRREVLLKWRDDPHTLVMDD